MKITRRSLAKGLAAVGAAAPIRGLLRGEASTGPAHSGAVAWKKVHPGVWKATIGAPERFTPVSSRLVPPQIEAFVKLPKVDVAPLPAIRGQQTKRGCVVQLPLRPNEQIYGLGLQFLSFAQRGKKKVVRVNADPRFDSHAPVPLYVTTEGIGILIDTARYATFYFGDARPKPTHAADLVNNTNTDPNYTHNIQDGDTGQITVEAPRASGVDIYLFAGPQMVDAVRRYNIFSGGGVVPPEWGLGFWYRPESRATQQSALALANEFRDRKIPCDVIGLEGGWQTHAYACTFVWDKDRFPDPAGFVSFAGAMNYKVNLWEHAFTHPASPLFPQIEPHSGDYGVWGGLVPDFAGEPARSAFGAYHSKTFLDAGISGFKLDECDNSDFTGGWSFPKCSVFPSGVDGEQMHNVFGLRYQMTIWNEFRKRKTPTYNLVRSSGALAAPYPFVLYSDLYVHRDFIRALVNSGFSGLLWCPEVRDAVREEDLIRRLQSVVFSPLAMINGWYIKNPPWKQLNRRLNNADQFLDGWEKLEARCREIIGRRTQLVPYLTAAFQRYAEDGTPPFRALVLDAPDNKRLWAVDDQYMIGDRMMVAPIFAENPNSAPQGAPRRNPEGTRRVVLPEGGWHDFWTGEAFKGGTEISVPTSTEKIPVYVKTGSIVPWADVGLYAGAPETRRLTARGYGDGSKPFTLTSDSGTLHLTWTKEQAAWMANPLITSTPGGRLDELPMNPNCKCHRREPLRLDRFRNSGAPRSVPYLVLLTGLLVISAGELFAASGVIRPGDPWLDNPGQRIQAHGGGITIWKGTYYWFGEDRSQSNDPDKRFVACYSSRDLVHWKSRGQVLALADPGLLGPHWVLERPKVYANSRTGKFVMYAHLDDAHYKFARVVIAVSDRIVGPYSYVKNFRPLDEESRHIGQFVDDDGSAYLIFESRPTKGFFLARLTDDFMNVEKTCFIPAPLEGGALVHVGNLYYVVGSHMTGWRPNPNVYASAPELTGPWTEFKNLASPEANNYDSQSTMLLKVTGSSKTTVIFMGDLWRPKELWDSHYFWIPLEIANDSMHLPPPQPWSLNVKTGESTMRVDAK